MEATVEGRTSGSYSIEKDVEKADIKGMCPISFVNLRLTILIRCIDEAGLHDVIEAYDDPNFDKDAEFFGEHEHYPYHHFWTYLIIFLLQRTTLPIPKFVLL